MEIKNFIDGIHALNIKHFIGVPDSVLKPLCDYLNLHETNKQHMVPVNEGAAVALAAGYYLGSEQISCVYMQNSGMGNALNPIASLIHQKVYDIPMLFLIGYRGEPNQKDEPQHIFQGEITCPLLELLGIEYALIDKETNQETYQSLLHRAKDCLSANKQFAFVIKKGALKNEQKFNQDNGFTFKREDAIQTILAQKQSSDLYITTTGKISREAYEQSDALYGEHKHLFLTVGSMGHASMIAQGVAAVNPNRRVFCIDGDGAALMHMGSMDFIANMRTDNLCHIILNNNAHESVGGMPTNCQNTSFADTAKVFGYAHVYCAASADELTAALKQARNNKGPIMIEVKVALGAREDLGRPKESAVMNKQSFMAAVKGE